MPSAQESMDIKKAMAYDLLTILADKDVESYTPKRSKRSSRRISLGSRRSSPAGGQGTARP